MSLSPRYDVTVAPAEAVAFFGLPNEFLRLDPVQESTTVQLLMNAAVEAGELYTNRVFRQTTFIGNFPCFEYDDCRPRTRQGFIDILRSPLGAVSAFEVDLEGEASPTVLTPDIARMPGYSRVFVPKDFEGTLDPDVAHPIRITFEAGYVNAAATFPDIRLPAAVHLGLNQHITYLFENRGDVKGDFADAIPDEVKRSYDTIRLISGFA